MIKKSLTNVKIAKKIYYYADKFVCFIYLLAGITTSLFLGILFVQVFMRYVFNNPIYGLDEMVIALMIWSMALGFSIVYWRNEHAKIEFTMKYCPRIIHKSIYHLINLIVFLSGMIIASGAIKLFKMQSKMMPLGGLTFTKAYYYALPMIVMGLLLIFMSAIKTIVYIATDDDSILIEEHNEGGSSIA